MSDIGKKFTVTARPFYVASTGTRHYHDDGGYGPKVDDVVTVQSDADGVGDYIVEYNDGSRDTTAYVNRESLTPVGAPAKRASVATATITRAALLDVLANAGMLPEPAAILADAAEHRSR